MAKSPRDALIACDGELFIWLEIIMHPLCAITDGVEFGHFGKRKKPYIRLRTAIAWCQNETQYDSTGKTATTLRELRRIQREYDEAQNVVLTRNLQCSQPNSR